MPTTKVTRGYQITIPAEIREETNIEIGDQLTLILEAETNTVKIIVPRKSRTPIKLGRDITPEEIEESITKGFQQCQQ
jgi:AbrB family looped-hinge helix DNA binding protein